MSTNDERREVAAKLREYAGDRFTINTCLRFALFGDYPSYLQYSDEKVLHVLADLIEPEPERMCRIKDMRCTECGGNLDSYFHFSDESSEWKIRPFCSWCGAKVVDK